MVRERGSNSHQEKFCDSCNKETIHTSIDPYGSQYPKPETGWRDKFILCGEPVRAYFTLTFCLEKESSVSFNTCDGGVEYYDICEYDLKKANVRYDLLKQARDRLVAENQRLRELLLQLGVTITEALKNDQV